MTLAGAILLFIISCTTQLFSLDWLSAQSSGPTPGTSNAAQNQTPAPTSTPPESPKPDTAAKPSTAKPRPKGTAKKSPAKKVVTSNCDTTPAAAASAPTSSSNPPTSLQDPANADAAAAPATAPVTPAQNCPPQKVIVRQGGVSEPSIQLAGGNQASPKKDSVNQMLQSTEGNLKKISGQPLDTTQQGTVSQIRQFMDQSKEALAGGDVERAHTLAWKAELLSEDLVKPSK